MASHQTPETAPGWAVLDAAVAIAEDALGSDLAAAFAIGSLAHGGFAPAASDVDLALLTQRDAPIGPQAALIAERVADLQNDELSRRLSIFHAPRRLLGAPPPGSRFPAIDRLDLLDSGVLLAGDDVRDAAARPAHEEVVAEAIAFTADRTGVEALVDVIAIARAGQAELRATTKAILSPVRLEVLVADGRVMGNDAVSARYGGGFAGLVQAAARWRAEGRLDEPTSVAAGLADGLLPLWLEQLADVRRAVGASVAQPLDPLVVALEDATLS